MVHRNTNTSPHIGLLGAYIFPSSAEDEEDRRIRTSWIDGLPHPRGHFGFNELTEMAPSIIVTPKGGTVAGTLQQFVESQIYPAYPNIDPEWELEEYMSEEGPDYRVIKGPVFMQADPHCPHTHRPDMPPAHAARTRRPHTPPAHAARPRPRPRPSPSPLVQASPSISLAPSSRAHANHGVGVLFQYLCAPSASMCMCLGQGEPCHPCQDSLVTLPLPLTVEWVWMW